MHSRRISIRWLAVLALMSPFFAGGCGMNEPPEETDFRYPVNLELPLVIQVNSKSEMLVHGKWIGIYEKSKTVDTWFEKQAARYREAYAAEDKKLPTRTRLGKKIHYMPTEVVIEVDSSTIKSGIINSMMRRAKQVGFAREPKLRSLDPKDQQPTPAQ